MNYEISTESTTMDFKSIANKIETGEIRLPDFQRSFVWSEEGVAKLFDSIVKGLPFGSVTFLETSLKLKSKFIADNTSDQFKGQKMMYALDGQQRLTTIYGVFKGIKYEKVDFKNIYINLERKPKIWTPEDIVRVSKNITEEGKWATLFDVLNNIGRVRKELDLTEEETGNAFGFSSEIKGYKLPINKTISSIDNVEIAVDIFVRLNNTGKPLSAYEIISAIVYDEERNFNLEKKVSELNKNLKNVNYEIDGNTVTQIVSTLTRRKLSSIYRGNEIREDYIENWNKVVKSLEKAIDFLSRHLKIERKNDLPNINFIHTFSYFFHNNKKVITGRQQMMLEEYFFKSTLSMRYKDSTTGKAQTDLTKIDSIIKGIRPMYDYDIITDLDMVKNNGIIKGNKLDFYSKTILSLLKLKNPKSFKNGQDVTHGALSKTNELQRHHIFPKSKYGAPSNSIFNMALLDSSTNGETADREPTEYFPYYERLITEAGKDFNKVLRSHFIYNLDESGISSLDMNQLIEYRIKNILSYAQSRYSNLEN